MIEAHLEAYTEEDCDGGESYSGGVLEHGDAALLAAMGVLPTTIRAVESLAGGISGTRVLRLLLARPVVPGAARSYTRRIYKRIEPEGGWLGVASHDMLTRELRLHSSGVLADLPHEIATAVLAHIEQSTAGTLASSALLLSDEGGHLVRHPTTPPPGRLPPAVVALLARLARLHARYWEDPRLSDPSLGLTSSRDALLLIAPARIAERIAAGDANRYLPLALGGWDAFFRLAAPSDAACLRSVLADPTPYLGAIDALPRTLVHGDIWGPNLGWLPPTHRAPRRGWRLLLLDWALASSGPCVYDPLWLCGTWHALNPVRVLAVYRACLTRYLAARGLQLPPSVWLRLADAGYLRTALTCGEALARAAAESDPGRGQRCKVERSRWWAHRAALAAQRLVS